MSFSPASLRPIPADPIVMEGLEFPDFDSLDLNDTSPSGFDRFVAVMNEMPYKPRFPPLDDLPCANVQPDEYQACSKAGNKACSACKLVSYCSQVSRPFTSLSLPEKYLMRCSAVVPEKTLEDS